MKTFLLVYTAGIVIALANVALGVSDGLSVCWLASAILGMTVINLWGLPSISCEDY
jgi:hypothetical protein